MTSTTDSTIVTYQNAYTRQEWDLCVACARNDDVLGVTGSLSQVQHGAHRGECQGCAILGAIDVVECCAEADIAGELPLTSGEREARAADLATRAAKQIKGWLSAAREHDDQDVVHAIETLGLSDAADVYATWCRQSAAA